jgi:hypothetical protein
MPLMPFMGISVILHVFVIASYVFVNRVAPNRVNRATKKMCPTVSRYVSALIIGFVFGGMFTGAYFLVAASVNNEHSSVRLAATYISAAIVQYNEGLFLTSPEEDLPHVSE